MATIPKLYNLNEARTYVYEQQFVLYEENNCQKYLDHIPKAGSLYVEDVITGEVFVITTDKEAINNRPPEHGEVFCEYRSEFDYVSAKGLLIFNPDDAASGDTFKVRYIPVASRIDAEVINKLIDHHNTYEGNVWTKEDLLTPVQNDIVNWTAVKDRPGYATETTGGLITAEDAQLIRSIPRPYTPPLGGLTIRDLQFKPTLWGDSITLALGPGFTITKDTDLKGTLGLDAAGIRTAVGITQDQVTALAGATGTGKSPVGPGEQNKYVLDQDPRLSDYRNPLAHTHAISDVNNLTQELDGKAKSVHTHSTDEITGIEALKGEDGKSCSLVVDSTTTVPSTQGAKVTNIGTVYDVKLKFEIPRGIDGKMVMDWQGWESLTEEQKAQIRIVGPKGANGEGAAVQIDKITAGPEGSEVTYVVKDPVKKYWESADRELWTTGLELTIPRGDKGEQGVAGAVKLGTVTTSESGSDASVVIHEPEVTEIGGITYYASTVDFTLPRGPKGTGTVSRITFTSTDEGWSTVDEDENYTLTIQTTGAIPVSLAYEEISSGLYEIALASVRYEYNKIYIISDHKFSGRIFVDGSRS